MSEYLSNPVMVNPHARTPGGIVACEQCQFYVFNYDAPNSRPVTCSGTTYIGNPVHAFMPAVVYGIPNGELEVTATSLASKIMHEDALCEPDECI